MSHDHVDTRIGDWLFRHIAFPGEADTTTEYFQRYYRGAWWADFREQVLSARDGLREFCEELIDRYRLDGADIVGVQLDVCPACADRRLRLLRARAEHLR
ncbi:MULTISPECIES: hypothetical protein [unclassified Streptomyces]|uniref:hypothetical protein n=1 Tax=unclassified Streptomyces TaxID=2593676 RepID=UPI0033BFA7EC